MASRIQQQIDFVLEIDRLKSIDRRITLADGSRFENTAEHSWHIATMAFMLAEYGPPGVDIQRTIRMLLVHDIVEIDAGDTFCYDAEAAVDKEERETRAAHRLFGLLPEDKRDECLALWHEFEARETPEARFANSIDRFQPLLINIATQGGSWRRHGVQRAQVEERLRPIGDGAPALWEHTQRLLEEADSQGWFDPE